MSPAARPPKLLVLHTHPVQYYAPVFRTIAHRAQIAVKVIYLSDAGASEYHDPGFDRPVAWDVDLLDGYDHHVLRPNLSITQGTFWNRHDTRLTAVLAEERPDWILLYGYASRMNWVALRWAKRHGVGIAYYSDSNARLVGRRSRSAVIKTLLLRWYFSQVDAFLSPSEANRTYLRMFGADEGRIHRCPFAIDVARFRAARSGVSGAQVDFVWAGKVIDLKRPMDFVNALAEVNRRGRHRPTASMIGTGPSMNEVHRHAAAVLPAETLSFAGFVNQSAMPAELCRGSVFVFTSEADQYGLVVTEAAACGRALIVADVNGCVGPSGPAQHSRNALIYPAGDVAALADCMEALLASQFTLRNMQRASVEIAASHDIDCAADVLETVVARRPHANAA